MVIVITKQFTVGCLTIANALHFFSFCHLIVWFMNTKAAYLKILMAFIFIQVDEFLLLAQERTGFVIIRLVCRHMGTVWCFKYYFLSLASSISLINNQLCHKIIVYVVQNSTYKSLSHVCFSYTPTRLLCGNS